MYTNLTKCQAFPLAIMIYSRPRCFKLFHNSKPQYFPTGSYPKPLLNPSRIKTLGDSRVLKSMDFSTCSHYMTLGMGNIGKPRSGFRLRSAIQCCRLIKAPSFSSSYTQRDGGKNGGLRPRKTLPWLASNRAKEVKWSEKATSTKTGRSSWEESANRLEKGSGRSSREESAKRSEEATTMKSARSSWKVSAENFVGKSGRLTEGSEGGRNRVVDKAEDRQSGYVDRYGSSEEDKEEEGEVEANDDPRWDKIKDRFRGMVDVKAASEKPELQRWNKQENWGRKTWKEATESTVPKMAGEGIYGVGPVLAALSAHRREFYALYLQEGLDLSNNNRKKKDKKGFEKVLRMAEKIGLSIREASKHDLNMVVDNRPHQGLVLDASPLEMVKIKELDPISKEEGKGSLWVALDEVTDPQNLGAIIRSAYFFGASGVVLCAKNSAPLTGVVSKASAGALELMELRYCKNMMQFLVTSAENGWRVLGGSVSPKAVPLDEVLPGAPTVLVLGSEGTGLRPLVERSCTQLLRIPGNVPLDFSTGGVNDTETAETNSGCSGEEFRSFLAVESLNVSVAAGVLLHHLIGNNYKSECHIGDKPTDALEQDSMADALN
jgi:21S rRNA (GM2251-2'-O)-methyltransferase